MLKSPVYCRALLGLTFATIFFACLGTAKAQQNIGIGSCIEYCTVETDLDVENSLTPSNFALNLPFGTFYFRAPGQFLDNMDGTAQLVGEVYDQSDPNKGFFLDIRFSGKLQFFDMGFPPAGHPIQGLIPSSYFMAGGPIAPQSWTYFTSAIGGLYGVGDHIGSVIAVSSNGGALQMGEGASNRTLDLGGFVNLDFTTATQPTSGSTFPTNMTGDVTVTFGFDCAALGRLYRPGTGDDFQIRTSTIGSQLTGGVGEDVKISFDGDVAGLIIESPGGTFVNQAIMLGVTCFIECSAAPPTMPLHPEVFINMNYGGLLAIGPGGLNPATVLLPTGGHTIYATINPGHSGVNFILQAFCLSPAANNGLFASSNAHMIKIF